MSGRTESGKVNTPRKYTENIDFLLKDARPEVSPPDTETMNRIFHCAIRDASVSSASQHTYIANARFVLSAAFCVCAAAGLLLLRSVAAVRTAGHTVASVVQPGALHELAVPTSPVQRGLMRLIVKQCQSNVSPEKVSQALAPRYRSELRNVQSDCSPPQVPVCGMTTFVLFTPLPPTAVPQNNQIETADPQVGSLLVCVVNADDHSETTASPPDADGDLHEGSCSTEIHLHELPDMYSTRHQRLEEWETLPKPAYGAVLVGAEPDSYSIMDQSNDSSAFASGSGPAPLNLALPYYNTI